MKVLFSKKRVSIFVVCLLLVFCLTSTLVSAYNSSGDKAFQVWGYKYDPQYTGRDKLMIYLDKNAASDIVAGGYQFKVHNVTDNTDYAAGTDFTATAASGSGVSNPTGSPSGTIVTLDFASDLAWQKTFEVTVNRNIKANNGMTLGHTYKNEDRVFRFRSPDSSYNYGTNVYLSLRPTASDTGIPVEGNVGFIADRPLSDSERNTILSGMHLEISGTDVEMDDFEDPYDTGNAIYEPVSTTWKTGFFMPLTWGGSSTGVYNLVHNTTYTFKIPAFGDYAGGSYTFSTNASPDIPSKIANAPTVSMNGGNATITWTTSSSNCTQYKIYRSTDKYWNYSTLVATVQQPDPFTSTTSYVWNSAVSGSYVRIQPIGDGGIGGFSPYVQIP